MASIHPIEEQDVATECVAQLHVQITVKSHVTINKPTFTHKSVLNQDSIESRRYKCMYNVYVHVAEISISAVQ